MTFRLKNDLERRARSVIIVSDDFRAQIHPLLDKVRKIVAQAEINDNKRNAIYKKIGALAQEVDTSKTSLESANSAIRSVTEAIADGAQNLEKAVPFLDKVKKLLFEAKAETDTKELPAPEPRKHLPPPMPRPEKPSDLDDEITF